MNLAQYQELASVTDATMSNKWLNWLYKFFYKQRFTLNRILCTIHMVLGMMSELEELNKAIRTRNRVNIKEELGDIMWYVANYCTHNNLNLTKLQIIEPILYESKTNILIDGLVNSISLLSNTWKRQLAYKREPSDIQILHVDHVLTYTILLAKRYDFTMEEICERNIAKLQERFKGKFSQHAALNRDLVAELKVLQS